MESVCHTYIYLENRLYKCEETRYGHSLAQIKLLSVTSSGGV